MYFFLRILEDGGKCAPNERWFRVVFFWLSFVDVVTSNGGSKTSRIRENKSKRGLWFVCAYYGPDSMLVTFGTVFARISIACVHHHRLWLLATQEMQFRRSTLRYSVCTHIHSMCSSSQTVATGDTRDAVQAIYSSVQCLHAYP